jgi:hypothetical protein
VGVLESYFKKKKGPPDSLDDVREDAELLPERATNGPTVSQGESQWLQKEIEIAQSSAGSNPRGMRDQEREGMACIWRPWNPGYGGG